MKIDLETAVDTYLNSVGLLDPKAPEFASRIYVYGSYAKKAFPYLKAKKLKIPAELITEEEVNRRSKDVYAHVEKSPKRVYHFKIDKSNIKYYL